MKYGSVCSGIEAATAAWHPLGWEPQFFSEIEPFPCSVLAHHYPHVPNYGDMTKYKEWPDAVLDVLVGGTPCQSYSVAGLRKGLDDPRGNLMLTYVAIARKYRSRWVVWENVPGVLSSNEGRDFGSLLGLLTGRHIECPPGGWQNSGVIPGYKNAYGIAWRVLDAQYFGVPQRRRRVFVVGYLGDWRRAASVLFERHSLSGHPAPSRKAGQVVAGTITEGAFSGGAGVRPEGAAGNHFLPVGIDEECNATVDGFGPLLRGGQGGTRQAVATFDRQSSGEYGTSPVASTMSARDYKSAADLVVAFTARADGHDATVDISPTLRSISNTNGHQAGSHGVAVAFAQNTRDEVRILGGDGQIAGALAAEPGTKQQTYLAFQISHGEAREREIAPPLMAHGGPNRHGEGSYSTTDFTAIHTGAKVRRLTPMECERLQGFEDRYTLILHKGKPAADGPRYKGLGNSMNTGCMRWIGERIQLVDSI